MNRTEFANLIVERLKQSHDEFQSQFKGSADKIGYFVVDDLLPRQVAKEIYDAFPNPDAMVLKKSLREDKYVAAQMDQYNPLLEEVIYAFQDQRVVKLIGDICGIDSLYPDPHLYVGGISLMLKNQFLNPHLDNSHGKDRQRWRVLNLLYYTTPDWEPASGGNLEIWPDGLRKPQVTIESLFNRLAVMATHGGSWHSVSPIRTNTPRTCVSNYFFSDHSLRPSDEFHVTSFRGRPEQRVRDIILQADIALRQGLRKLFPKGIVENPHVYERSEESTKK